MNNLVGNNRDVIVWMDNRMVIYNNSNRIRL
jgi:hypothetical protein